MIHCQNQNQSRCCWTQSQMRFLSMDRRLMFKRKECRRGVAVESHLAGAILCQGAGPFSSTRKNLLVDVLAKRDQSHESPTRPPPKRIVADVQVDFYNLLSKALNRQGLEKVLACFANLGRYSMTSFRRSSHHHRNDGEPPVYHRGTSHGNSSLDRECFRATEEWPLSDDRVTR